MSTTWVSIDLFDSDEVSISYSRREEDGHAKYHIRYDIEGNGAGLPVLTWADVQSTFDELRVNTILPLELELWLRVNKEIPKDLNKLTDALNEKDF